MASSIRTGVAHARKAGAGAVLILLGDMPLVTCDDIDAILKLHSQSGDKTIVQAAHDGKPGNPVLFPCVYFEHLSKLNGDRGARELIRAHSQHCQLVDIGVAAMRDFDTPQSFHINAI